MIKHTYTQTQGGLRLGRFAVGLPGRRLLAAIWAWM
jgi:hypothetical protein